MIIIVDLEIVRCGVCSFLLSLVVVVIVVDDKE